MHKLAAACWKLKLLLDYYETVMLELFETSLTMVYVIHFIVMYASKFRFFHRILSLNVNKYYNEINLFLNFKIRFHHIIICYINKIVIKIIIIKNW